MSVHRVTLTVDLELPDGVVTETLLDGARVSFHDAYWDSKQDCPLVPPEAASVLLYRFIIEAVDTGPATVAT